LRPKGDPEPVFVHDFEIKGQGKVAPYGVYDIGANEGWVNVDAETAEFGAALEQAGSRRFTTRAGHQQWDYPG
jgi:hypothetical protein